MIDLVRIRQTCRRFAGLREALGVALIMAIGSHRAAAETFTAPEPAVNRVVGTFESREGPLDDTVEITIERTTRNVICGQRAFKVYAKLTGADNRPGGRVWAQNYTGYFVYPAELHLFGEAALAVDPDDDAPAPIRSVVFGIFESNRWRLNVHSVARTHAGEVLQNGWNGFRNFSRKESTGKGVSK